MDYKLSDKFMLMAQAGEAARAGDWPRMNELLLRTDQFPDPADAPEAARYLALLRATLAAARTSRSQAMATLARLNAATEFNGPRDIRAAERQDPGDSTYS